MKKIRTIMAIALLVFGVLAVTIGNALAYDVNNRIVHGVVYETYTVEIDGYIEDMTAIETDDSNIWEVYGNIDEGADLIVTFDTMGTDAVEDDIITQVVTIINY